MILSDKKAVQHFVQLLSALGLKRVVICPGSRNAPLTISFNRHPDFICTSIRDERSAAFFALGQSIELQQPVAVVCTSGSASLNFAPAIAEAYYQRVPLIVITADRPVEWTDQGDGQTIDQKNIYSNYIRKSYNLFGDTEHQDELWYNDRCVNEGFLFATQKDKGPVHFNLPFREPLYGQKEAENTFLKKQDKSAFERRLTTETLKRLTEQFNAAEKVMVLTGQHLPNDEFEHQVKKIAGFNNTIVLTESTSNIHDCNFVSNIDRCISTLSENEAKDMMPYLLITVGGAIVSKRIKALLRKYKPAHHWNVDRYDAAMDTYQSLTDPLYMDATAFLKQLLPHLQPRASGYRDVWLACTMHRKEKTAAFYNNCPFSDFYAFGTILKHLPKETTLHLSNSSPIRYAQLFDSPVIYKTWSNRGTSGIDGCTSTAMGSAFANPDKPFVLITGDVAFYYDINGLWNNAPIENLKIILINNGGGNIFRIIPGPAGTEELKPYFETSMKTNAGSIAKHFNWNYFSAKDKNSLDDSLVQFFNSKTKRCILEIFTDPVHSPEVLDQYWHYLKK